MTYLDYCPMNFYFVVVAPCDKKRLLLMKVDAPDRPIVLVEFVPRLLGPSVKIGKDSGGCVL